MTSFRPKVKLTAGNIDLFFLQPKPSDADALVKIDGEEYAAWIDRCRDWLTTPDVLVDYLIDGKRDAVAGKEWRADVRENILHSPDDVASAMWEVAFRARTDTARAMQSRLAGSGA